MRVVYAVHGYGRGHATRALAVLPRLAEKHQLLVLAGGDAYEAIWPDYAVVRLPTLGFAYGHNTGRRSNWATLKRNLPAILDLLLHGPVFNMVRDAIREFSPDAIISDAEAWTHHVGRAMKIPRISFDHIGIMQHCRLELSFIDRFKSQIDTWCYRALVCRPEQVIVSSFYDAPPKRPGVTVVSTLAREAVRQAAARPGEHLLVYFNKGEHQLRPHILQALEQIGIPVHIYGSDRRNRQGQIQFLPTSNLPFIEDLVSCRAVLSTAGNQLMGEAITLGKPVLVIPEHCVEQRMNARAVERLGIGMQSTLETFSVKTLTTFLGRLDEFIANIRPLARDGMIEALQAIEHFLGELGAGVEVGNAHGCAAALPPRPLQKARLSLPRPH